MLLLSSVCQLPNLSLFGKGKLEMQKALKFGYKWSVRDGMQIRFWEDTWFDNFPLSVQFWDLYVICNQMGCRFADIWDGQEVKLTFRRTFDANMLENWCTIVMEFTPLVLFMQS